MTDTVIVSRHPAATEFIARELGCKHIGGRVFEPDGTEIPVLASASAEDVQDKHIFGNVPLHLAARARKVTVVEFEGAPPRGQEYTLEDMKAAGVRLQTYTVYGPLFEP